MLSITSDYAAGTGCPEPYLRRIAAAGFTHVHWCHQWNTDFLYADSEVEQIARWLDELGLSLTDLHASAGREKGWTSAREYERLAGVELVVNRIQMAARLGTDVVILHLPGDDGADGAASYWPRVWRSMDALCEAGERDGVRIALENGDFDALADVFARYDASRVGLCYDCGHGNLVPDGLDRLAGLADRLISLHLHDNDGLADLHKLPLTGTVDWPRLAGLIAASSYGKWVSMESTMAHADTDDEAAWLHAAREAGGRLTEMIAAARDA